MRSKRNAYLYVRELTEKMIVPILKYGDDVMEFQKMNNHYGNVIPKKHVTLYRVSLK
jgi:hypothetical protein